MNIKIEAYSQGPRIFRPQVLKEHPDTPVRLSMSPKMKYDRANDMIGFQLDIDGEVDEARVLKFGFLLAMTAEGIRENLSVLEEDSTERTEILSLLSETVLKVATGAVASFTATEEMPGLVLPNVDISEFAKTIILQPVKQSKDQ